MSFVFYFWTGVTFFLLFLDAFFYATFSLQTFRFDSVFVLCGYITASLILMKYGYKPLPKKVEVLHKKIVFPLLLISSLIFLAVEKLQFNNFIFSYIHIHPFLWLYLPTLSGFIVFAPRLKVERSYALFLYAPAFALWGLYYFSLLYPDFFTKIVKEDNLIEYIQFIFFVLSSFYGFFSFRALFKHKDKKSLALLFLLFGFGLFFMAGEEISWGQRLLGIQTPDALSKINVQNETTVHNLSVFQNLLPFGYILIGLYGSFSQLVVKKLFKQNRILTALTPPHFLFLPFFIVSLFYIQYLFGNYTYAGLVNVSGALYPQKWHEIVETFMAFGLFGFSYYTYKVNNK